ESVQAESDATVARSSTVAIKSRMPGGFLGAAARKLLTGESLFLQELTFDTSLASGAARTAASGDALLAPKAMGDIAIHSIGSRPASAAAQAADEGQPPTEGVPLDAASASSASNSDLGPLLIRRGAFLAASMGVQVTSKAMLGSQFLLKGAFSGHGLFCLRAEGAGQVAFSSCGSIYRYDLGVDEERIVDNDHVVAWTETLQYKLAFQSRSLWHSATSGEGLACFFKGPGTVFVQSHSPKDFSFAGGGGSASSPAHQS
ncbi:unnamed protein product, partial [Polarella glacialis]